MGQDSREARGDGGSARAAVACSADAITSMSELRILPLGGCGEIGLNATLCFDGKDALLIDCGILLGVPNAPGVDRAVPGFEPLFRDDRRLQGVVLTHGH